MRTRLLLAVAAFAALSGCVIHEHDNVPPPGVPGNVNMVWNFPDGISCGQAGIDHVRISIPGESLANGGIFPCTVAGTQGIQLQDFAAGGYSFTIAAEDASFRQIYGASGSFTVNGDVTVSIALQTLAAPGNVNVLWSFSDGNSCDQLAAFVDHVRITIDGEALANNGIFPCDVAGSQGVQLQDFQPGTYSFSVTAETAGNVALYAASGAFTVNGDVTVQVVLTPVNSQQNGNLIVYWTFPNSMSCTSAGVDHMVINIPGEQLQNNGIFPCSTAGTQGIQLNDFAARGYTVNVSAVDSNGIPLYTGSSNVNVNGDTQVTVQLVGSTSSNATLQLRWSFLDATGTPHTCAEAGMQYVSVQLGNFPAEVVPCDANGIDGADFVNLAAGSYQVVLEGLADSNTGTQPSFQYSQTIVVTSPSVLVHVELAPLTGSWDLYYNFSNAGSCAIAGVSTVSVAVYDANNNEISGTQGQHSTCGDASTNGNRIQWDSFPPGNVTIQMFGYDSAGNTIRGATRSTTLTAGAANQTTVTLDTCGTQGSGC